MKKFEYCIENEMTGMSVSGIVTAESAAEARTQVKTVLARRKRSTAFAKGLKIKSVKEVA